MKNSPSNASALKTLVCANIGHRYVITNQVTAHLREYKCISCHKEVCDTPVGFLADLTTKQREINATLSNYVQKRRKRLTTKLTV